MLAPTNGVRLRLLPDSLWEGDLRVDVHGDVGQGLQRGGEVGRHGVVFREPGLGAGAVARGLDLEELFGKARERGLNLRGLDRILSGGLAGDGALGGEEVELHHLGAGVRLARSETDRAEE